MNNKIKAFFKKINLNYRKELVVLLGVNLVVIALMVVTFIFTHSSLIFIPYLFFLVLINGVCFYRYLHLYGKNLTNQMKEIVYLFRYLYLDINNGVNVLSSLEALKSKASLKMNEKLANLLNEASQDHSLMPYLNFAHQFSSVLIEEMMINLYRYEQKKLVANLNNFNRTYLKLKTMMEEDNEHDEMKQFDFIKSTAIIGTAIIIVIVIIAVIIIVEGYRHG